MWTEEIRAALQARLDAGESLLSIANACGISQRVLHHFVHGKRSGGQETSLRLDTAEKLGLYLGFELRAVNSRPRKKAPKKR